MLEKLKQNLRIVMVETTHPGNIGASARAMKTMGLENLYLVKPKIFPNAEATARAAGADDILARAVVCESLEEALEDCVVVCASTARPRTISFPVFSPREYAAELYEKIEQGPVALVFGRESSGLSNEELEQCNIILQVPTNPEFSSLNVASAVQLLCYEFVQGVDFQNGESSTKDGEEKQKLATTKDVQYFYEHLETCLIEVGFLNPEQPKKLMRRLKALFNRAHLDENEVNILRGFLAAIQQKNKDSS